MNKNFVFERRKLNFKSYQDSIDLIFTCVSLDVELEYRDYLIEINSVEKEKENRKKTVNLMNKRD